MNSETKLFIGIIVATIALIAGAAFFLTKPAPGFSREQLIPKGAYTKGSANASTYLVEFSDFQCPACRAAKPIVEELVKENKDKLVFVYRHFPLDQHAFAQKAAEAVEAAGSQGKFWEMYDLVFDNQNNLSNELFTSLAAQLKLDIGRFNQQLNDNTFQQKVLADRDAGLNLGVNGTPAFFLNGKKLNLTSLADLKKAVEEVIK